MSQELDRAVAILLRDLNVVLGHHVSTSKMLKKVLGVNLSYAQSILNYCPDNPARCLEDFIQALTYFRTNVCGTPVGGVGGSNTSRPFRNEDSGETESVAPDLGLPDRVGQSIVYGIQTEREGYRVAACTDGFQVEEYPTAEQYSRLAWPPCIGTTGFRTLLCTTCATFRPKMWKHQLEVADYCISPHARLESTSV